MCGALCQSRTGATALRGPCATTITKRACWGLHAGIEPTTNPYQGFMLLLALMQHENLFTSSTISAKQHLIQEFFLDLDWRAILDDPTSSKLRVARAGRTNASGFTDLRFRFFAV